MKIIPYIGAALIIPAAISYAMPDPSPEVLKVVSSFYEEYSSNFEKPLINFNQIDPVYVDKITRMEAAAAAAEPELGGLDFDPVTWGKEDGDSMSFGSAVINSTGAMVTVTKTPDNKWLPVSRICVSLHMTETGWKIIDTLDPEFMGEKSCGAWAPGFFFPEIDFAHPKD